MAGGTITTVAGSGGQGGYTGELSGVQDAGVSLVGQYENVVSDRDVCNSLQIRGRDNASNRVRRAVHHGLIKHRGRFTVEVATTPDRSDSKESWDAFRPDFSKYDAVLSNYNGQAWPKEVQEAAKVDGANGWQSFRHVTFPIMLPVSITVLIIRIIFKLKLADIVINVTAGGPGGATDTVSSFIYRVYRDRSNVGYGTALAMVYLLIIIVLLSLLLRLSRRWTQNVV